MSKPHNFRRNALVIFAGSTAAQAISILVSPILTRLYSPEDFGTYSLFISITTVSGALACGRYELGITLPAEDQHALALFALCGLLAGAVSTLMLVPVWLWGTNLAAVLSAPGLAPWLWCVPAATLFTGALSAARYWLLRRKAFWSISANGVIRAVVAATCNVGFGMWGWTKFGLIGGIIISLITASLFLAWQIWRDAGRELLALNWRDIQMRAHEHRGFPVYSTGSALVETGAAQVPNFFLSSLFGTSVVGHFALAQRLATIPLSLVSNSIGDVFRQRASEVYVRQGDCLELYTQTLRRLALGAAPIFAVLAWGAPWLFTAVFGREWVESGEMVRQLTVMLGLRFVSSPLSVMFYIAGKQAADLAIQVVLIVAMVTAFMAVGAFSLGPNQAVSLYAIIYSVKYLLELYLSYLYARGKVLR